MMLMVMVESILEMCYCFIDNAQERVAQCN
jgi:hypothetical protein